MTEEDGRRAADQTVSVAIVALAVVLGLELLRVFFPLVSFYLREVADVGLYGVIPWALGPFLLSLGAPLLFRVAGLTGGALFAGGGLVVSRLLEQISVNSAFDLATSFVGITFFFWLLAALLASEGRLFALGALLGIAVDTAIKGGATTLDLSWINATWPIILVTIVSVALAFLLYSYGPASPVQGSWTSRTALPLVGIGPWLFLEMLILQNQGWLGSATGWPAWATLVWIGLGNVAAIVLASHLPTRRGPVRSAGFVMLGVAVLSAVTGWVFALAALLGLGMGGVWLAGVTNGDGRGGSVRAAVGLGVGNVLFVVLALLYYLPLQLDLPLSAYQVVVLAGILVAGAGLLAPRPKVARSVSLRPALVTAVAVFVAAVAQVVWSSPAADPGTGYPVRVMTYNIAQGINTEGRVDPEGIAREIEKVEADIAGLQEVSRGWLITGSTDLVAWMDARLPHGHSAWAWAEDGGNATYSLYPIVATESDLLPTLGTLLERSYIETVITVTDAGDLTVINTHLQNSSSDDLADAAAEAELHPVHEAQFAVIRDAWSGRPQTVIVGDTNALPHWAQTQQILAVGFEDAWEAGEGPGFTFETNGIRRRIDWIFHTPDLESIQAVVIDTGASLDHLPVVAALRPVP